MLRAEPTAEEARAQRLPENPRLGATESEVTNIATKTRSVFHFLPYLYRCCYRTSFYLMSVIFVEPLGNPGYTI